LQGLQKEAILQVAQGRKMLTPPLNQKPQAKKPKKAPGPKKEEIIAILECTITDTQWDLIAKLRGLPTPNTTKKKEAFLNKLFKKTITTAHAKSKGRALQQWLASHISDFVGRPWGKDEEIDSRGGGQSGPDVSMSTDVRRLFPLTSECKSGDQWNLVYAIKQCQANLYPGTEWLVVLDRPSPLVDKRIPPIVVLDGEAFFKILHRAGELVDIWKEE
jgi:hypothetical protein